MLYLIVRTNSHLHPQLGETINNIIGTTLNPVNQLLSCGGSSGGMYWLLLRWKSWTDEINGETGEGALQALRGSSVGLGTDIGQLAIYRASFPASTSAQLPNRWFGAHSGQLLWNIQHQAHTQSPFIPRCRQYGRKQTRSTSCPADVLMLLP